MADKTTTLKTKTGDNVYPNVIGDNRKNAFVDSSTITHHFYDQTHKVGFQIANETNIKIQNSLQKPAGLTKTKLVGVGTNGQENIEIGDNLTLANGKLSSTGGGSVPDNAVLYYTLSYDEESEGNETIPLIKPVPFNTHAFYYISIRISDGSYFKMPYNFIVGYEENDPSAFYISAFTPSFSYTEDYLSDLYISTSYGLVVNNNMITALIPIGNSGANVFTPSKLVTLNGEKLYRNLFGYDYTLYSYTHTIRIKSTTESLDIVVTAETDNETKITTFPALCQVLSGSTLDCHGHITSANKQPILIEINAESFKVYYLNNQNDTGSEEQIDFTTSDTPEITDKVRPHKVYLKGQY